MKTWRGGTGSLVAGSGGADAAAIDLHAARSGADGEPAHGGRRAVRRGDGEGGGLAGGWCGLGWG